MRIDNPHALTRAISLTVTLIVVIWLRDYMRVTWEIAAPLMWLLATEVALYVAAVWTGRDES